MQDLPPDAIYAPNDNVWGLLVFALILAVAFVAAWPKPPEK
jgi:hypothetical protein